MNTAHRLNNKGNKGDDTESPGNSEYQRGKGMRESPGLYSSGDDGGTGKRGENRVYSLNSTHEFFIY
jgi:hypothetical protein